MILCFKLLKNGLFSFLLRRFCLLLGSLPVDLLVIKFSLTDWLLFPPFTSCFLIPFSFIECLFFKFIYFFFISCWIYCKCTSFSCTPFQFIKLLNKLASQWQQLIFFRFILFIPFSLLVHVCFFSCSLPVTRFTSC